MYKLLIADDEKIIREGLLNLINWNELGFEVVKTISDGEEVIEFLESELVDVVLTDIMMPHVSGIEVAKYVHDSQLPCNVVFLSGYKKFAFAHQAIKYGVDNYILKPSRMEEIVAVFGKIRKELDLKFKNMEEMDRLRGQWEEMYPVLAEKFVCNLVLSGELTDRTDIYRRMQLLYPEAKPETDPCVLATLKIEDYERYLQDEWKHSVEQFEETIYNFARMYHETGWVQILYKSKNIIRLFVIVRAGERSGETKDICTLALDDFVSQLSEIFQLRVNLEIEQIYEQIYQVVELRKELHRESDKDSVELQFLEQKKLIMTNVINRNLGAAHKILKSILQDNCSINIDYQKRIFADILSGVLLVIQENYGQLYQEIEVFVDYQRLWEFGSDAELIQYCDRLFERMRQYEVEGNKSDKLATVNKVKKHVNEHIYEDVSLEDIANEMFMTTTHLRRIFKKQTGETFLQYVTRKKMEEASLLLSDPKNKVYQVGGKLGYKTPRYFSKLFYSYYGCYPQQYRRKILNMGDMSDESE